MERRLALHARRELQWHDPAFHLIGESSAEEIDYRDSVGRGELNLLDAYEHGVEVIRIARNYRALMRTEFLQAEWSAGDDAARLGPRRFASDQLRLFDHMPRSRDAVVAQHEE